MIKYILLQRCILHTNVGILGKANELHAIHHKNSEAASVDATNRTITVESSGSGATMNSRDV